MFLNRKKSQEVIDLIQKTKEFIDGVEKISPRVKVTKIKSQRGDSMVKVSKMLTNEKRVVTQRWKPKVE